VATASVPPALSGVRAAQAALDTWLAELAPVDPATASLLPAWTVGHVLTHLARNADSHVRMLAGEPQYAGGTAQRDADIAAGARRPWVEQLADLRSAHERLDAAWSAVADWDTVAGPIGETYPLGEMPLRRWREVEVHRADLGPIDGGRGYTFADMPGEYVRRELAALTMRYRASKPIGMTQLPAGAATAPPPLRLAWLMGRAEIADLPPADIL